MSATMTVCADTECSANIPQADGTLCGVGRDGVEEPSCGRHFCGDHMFGGGWTQRCWSCLDAYEAGRAVGR